MRIVSDPKDCNIEPCVATIGFFDGVHQGHRFLIEQVKEVAQRKGLPSALITFPVHPRKVLDPSHRIELLSTFEEKVNLLRQTGVGYCFLLNFNAEISSLTASEFMTDVLKKQFRVDSLVIGYDHRFGHKRSEGFEDYCICGREIGMEVIQAEPFMQEGLKISSSAIRKALSGADLDLANQFLGYNYYLDGEVVTGQQLGRTIGFPTANLNPDPDKIIPADGVYAVQVTVEEKNFAGMMNIGHRPTIDDGLNRTLEVNILDFNEDIYGKSIKVSFVKRIRPEVKFNGLDALKAQIQDDQRKVEEIFRNKPFIF